ncbi:MAG: hypothetical protein HY023_07310 [Chloroflexi bacterium]|nr:hypothetical protein [Chloroflexota bacterium]MBI3763272.1 hypothetical protein [Chloroflexota bacterium]
MNTRIQLLSLLVGLSLALGMWGPVSAGSGTGKITCDGDGTLVFTGDFLTMSLSTTAGAAVHTKPATGTITISSGSAFTKYFSNDTTLYIGSGSATAKNVKNIKVVLSGAKAHLEAAGTGKLAVRGVGSCTTASGKVYTWKQSDTTVAVAP